MAARRRDAAHRRRRAAPGVRPPRLSLPPQFPPQRRSPPRLRPGHQPRLRVLRGQLLPRPDPRRARAVPELAVPPEVLHLHGRRAGEPVAVHRPRHHRHPPVQNLPLRQVQAPGMVVHGLLGRLCECVGYVTGKKLKLNTFSVRMLLINRYFDPSESKRTSGTSRSSRPRRRGRKRKTGSRESGCPNTPPSDERRVMSDERLDEARRKTARGGARRGQHAEARRDRGYARAA